jgi:virulence-associated protein VapD
MLEAAMWFMLQYPLPGNITCFDADNFLTLFVHQHMQRVVSLWASLSSRYHRAIYICTFHKNSHNCQKFKSEAVYVDHRKLSSERQWNIVFKYTTPKKSVFFGFLQFSGQIYISVLTHVVYFQNIRKVLYFSRNFHVWTSCIRDINMLSISYMKSFNL